MRTRGRDTLPAVHIPALSTLITNMNVARLPLTCACVVTSLLPLRGAFTSQTVARTCARVDLRHFLRAANLWRAYRAFDTATLKTPHAVAGTDGGTGLLGDKRRCGENPSPTRSGYKRQDHVGTDSPGFFYTYTATATIHCRWHPDARALFPLANAVQTNGGRQSVWDGARRWMVGEGSP